MIFKKLNKLPRWHHYENGIKKRGSLAWSAPGDPPQLGDQVNVSVNGIGLSTVISYFSEAGFLGLEVLPKSPPAWYVKQNGHGATCCVFGAELKGVQS